MDSPLNTRPSRSRARRRSHALRRRGALLAAVLVLLLVASMLIVAWAKSAATAYRQLESQSWRVQADWLVESALGRASAQLGSDPDYSGETWQIPAEEFGGLHGGHATITVEAVEQQPSQRRVRVEATFPSQSDQPAVKRKQILVSVE